MAKLYEEHGIPELTSLEYDPPPNYATIYSTSEIPWDSCQLQRWQIGLWGRADYWTALEAALLITEICPDDPYLYAVTEEIVEDEGYGNRYYSWRHEFQWDIAKSLLFLLERSPLSPKSAPVDWVRYYKTKCLTYFDSPFVGLRFGETWINFFCNELEVDSFAEQTKPASRAIVSNKLAILNQASQKWWANADPKDSTTHPKNADVVDWLVKHSYSPTLAASAASIIRPEWATTGRPPEK